MHQAFWRKMGPRSDEWRTPNEVFNPLNEEFRFTVDVCATRANHKCAKYFSQHVDGLRKSWAGEVCWMNPPYSTIAAWVHKAFRESRNGATVVCLLPASTDTRWWHAYARFAEVRFLRGRIQFERDGLKERPPFASVLLIFRGRRA